MMVFSSLRRYALSEVATFRGRFFIRLGLGAQIMRALSSSPASCSQTSASVIPAESTAPSLAQRLANFTGLPPSISF